MKSSIHECDGLGSIPCEWKIRRIKDVGRLVLGKMLTEKPFKGGLLKPYLKSRNIKWILPQLDSVEEMYFSKDELKSLRLCNGDLIFTEGGEVGKTAYWSGEIPECYIQNSVQKFTCNKSLYPRFLLYVSYELGNSGYYESIVNHVSIMHLTREKLSRVQLPFPPPDIQHGIADYLDEKIAAIDMRITMLEKKIAAYGHLKTSTINHVVTRGLDPNVKLKDSGVDWIGNVPEGWAVGRVKDVAIIGNGSDPKTEGDIPVYGSGDGAFKTCGEFKNGPVVLIGRKGATLHIPHYIEGQYWNVDTAFDVRVVSENNLRWFYYQAICFEYRYYMSQTTLPSMTQSDYQNMVIGIPAPVEQRAIADYLDTECAKIDKIAKLVAKEIELYRKLKRSLINELVTGKRKVA